MNPLESPVPVGFHELPPSVLFWTPGKPTPPAYMVLWLTRSIAIAFTVRIVRPLFAAAQLTPPSSLLNRPAPFVPANRIWELVGSTVIPRMPTLTGRPPSDGDQAPLGVAVFIRVWA